MYISEMFNQKKVVYSFEVFPPKRDSDINSIYNTLDELSLKSPDYISVTYGAGGSDAGSSTAEIASLIKNKYNIDPLAHLVSINLSKSEAEATVAELKNRGIDNVLTLRGDINPDKPRKYDFKYASELAKFIHSKDSFCTVGACYPEGHPECDSISNDIDNLKFKIDCGVSSLITQLFLDNNIFYSYLERLKSKNINIPIQAGIMPIISKNQIQRIVSMCGASLPSKLAKMISRFDHDPQAIRDAGIAYATEQIIDLIANGCDGIHLYTMNNPVVATKITDNVSSVISSENNIYGEK